MSGATQNPELRHSALHWLAERDAVRKSEGVRKLAQARAMGEVDLDADVVLSATLAVPGCPDRPDLVSPREVQRRTMHTPEGRAAMIHAMTHIEFNAIKLEARRAAGFLEEELAALRSTS